MTRIDAGRNNPTRKETIVGAGIIGLMNVYFAWKEAKARGEKIRITVFDAHPGNASSYHGTPHLTEQELFSVLPPGAEFIAGLQKSYTEGGVRVDNPAGLQETPAAKKYVNDVIKFIASGTQNELITILEELGAISVTQWRQMYDEADEELKAIFDAADFSPHAVPHHAKSAELKLRSGYEIQQFTKRPGVAKSLESEVAYQQARGYVDTQLLSPDQLLAIDPSYQNFVDVYTKTIDGKKQWKNDVAILWRPAGYIHTGKFLPLFQEYLRKNMGTYINADGVEKDCLRVKQGVVTALQYDSATSNYVDNITVQRDTPKESRRKKYHHESFSFCSGENVETLPNLGLMSPSSAVFAGATLHLQIDLSKISPEDAEKLKRIQKKNISFRSENSFTSVSQFAVHDNIFSVGIAGGKSFYGMNRPRNDDDFVIYVNVRQLNEINKVHPEILSVLLKRNTKAEQITKIDFERLRKQGYLKNYGCSRAATFDGAPILGGVFRQDRTRIENVRVFAGNNGGGVSTAPGTVSAARSSGMFRILEVTRSDRAVPQPGSKL